VDAPETVTATFWRKPELGQTIVQLFNKTHADRLIPIEDVRIALREDLADAKEAYLAWPKRKDLEIRDGETGTEIALPKMGLHEIVILQY
jgi:hypothetical protein